MGFVKENLGKIVVLVIVIIAMFYVYNDYLNQELEENNSIIINSSNEFNSPIITKTNVLSIDNTDIRNQRNLLILDKKFVKEYTSNGPLNIYSDDSYFVLSNNLIMKPGSSVRLDEPGEYYFYNYKDPSKSIFIKIN